MKRRDFLGGVFALAAAGRAWGANAPANRVRLALAGCREKGRGAALISRVLGVPGVEIATICDVDARAAAYGAAEVERLAGYRPKIEKDLRKVVEDKTLDGIVNATPDHWHAYSAVLAMRAGKHVYLEKPCAFCPREGEIILDTWKQTGKVFQMGTQRRSASSYINAVEAIRGGIIGETKWGKSWYMTRREPIGNGVRSAPPAWLDWDLWQGPAPRKPFQDNVVHYNWHWFRNWGTGESGNNSVHFVDIARWCLGVDWPSRVTSCAGKYWMPPSDDWEWFDTQNYTADFAGGKFITWEGLSCTSMQPYKGQGTGTLVYGTKGTAFFSPGGEVEICDLDDRLIRKWDKKGTMKVITNTDDRSGGGWLDSTSEHLENFVTCVRDNTPEKTTSNADIGVKSTFIALAANVAQLCGRPIDIDPKTGKLLTPEAAPYWSRSYEKGWELV